MVGKILYHGSNMKVDKPMLFTLPVIDDYMSGNYTKEEAVRRLLPQNLTDQYAFKSTEALAALTYKEGDNV